MSGGGGVLGPCEWCERWLNCSHDHSPFSCGGDGDGEEGTNIL